LAVGRAVDRTIVTIVTIATIVSVTFATWVVSPTPQDGDDAGAATVYVTRDAPHVVVRGTVKLPAMMGSGTLETELTARRSTHPAPTISLPKNLPASPPFHGPFTGTRGA
jgi:hypothetical protein